MKMGVFSFLFGFGLLFEIGVLPHVNAGFPSLGGAGGLGDAGGVGGLGGVGDLGGVTGLLAALKPDPNSKTCYYEALKDNSSLLKLTAIAACEDGLKGENAEKLNKAILDALTQTSCVALTPVQVQTLSKLTGETLAQVAAPVIQLFVQVLKANPDLLSNTPLKDICPLIRPLLEDCLAKLVGKQTPELTKAIYEKCEKSGGLPLSEVIAELGKALDCTPVPIPVGAEVDIEGVPTVPGTDLITCTGLKTVLELLGGNPKTQDNGGNK